MSSRYVAPNHLFDRFPVKKLSKLCLRIQQGLLNEICKIGLDPDPIPLPLLPSRQHSLESQSFQCAINTGYPVRRGIQINVFQLEGRPRQKIYELRRYPIVAYKSALVRWEHA